MSEKLFCNDCKNEIGDCDVCQEPLKKDDEIFCHSFDHIHKDCVDDWDSFVVSEHDRYEP